MVEIDSLISIVNREFILFLCFSSFRFPALRFGSGLFVWQVWASSGHVFDVISDTIISDIVHYRMNYY